MATIFNTKTLSEAVVSLAQLAPSRSPKPSLRNIHADIHEDHAILSATNLEQFLSMRVPCEAPGAGEQLWNAEKVVAILRTCREEQVKFSVTQGGIAIANGKSKWKLQTEDPSEFPKPPAQRGESVAIEVDADIFKPALKRTVIASDLAGTSARYSLSGVQISRSQDGTMLLSGTDGRKMACANVAAKSEGGFTALLPVGACKLIERALPAHGTVKISVDDANVTLECESAKAWTRQVEGRFPKVETWFDEHPEDVRCHVAASSFMTAIQQVALASSEESPTVDMRFEEGLLSLSSRSQGIGDAHSELPITYEGETALIRIHPQFVLELLRSMGDATIDLGLRFESATQDDGARACEFATMRVNGFRFAIAGCKVVQPQAVSAA